VPRQRTLPLELPTLVAETEELLSLAAGCGVADPGRETHASDRPAALPSIPDRAPLLPVEYLAVYGLPGQPDEAEAEDADEDPFHDYTRSDR
jgi:hypothetical protein